MSTENRLFYIQDSRSYCGNSALWWRPNGGGYTTNLNEAWRVGRERAESICRCRDTDKMWPCDQVDALAQTHFDSQNFTQLKAVAEFPVKPVTIAALSGVE